MWKTQNIRAEDKAQALEAVDTSLTVGNSINTADLCIGYAIVNVLSEFEEEAGLLHLEMAYTRPETKARTKELATKFQTNILNMVC